MKEEEKKKNLSHEIRKEKGKKRLTGERGKKSSNSLVGWLVGWVVGSLVGSFFRSFFLSFFLTFLPISYRFASLPPPSPFLFLPFL